MDSPPWDYEAFADRVTEWAATRPDIRLVVVFGSRARQDRPADVWSDIDIALVTTDPERYLQRSEWLTELGTSLLSCTEETPVVAFTERHVLFEDGLEVDFVPVPIDAATPLEEWADGRVLDELPDTITEYEAADCWRALFETVALFRWLAHETADAAGYDYPTTTDEQVSVLLEHLRPV